MRNDVTRMALEPGVSVQPGGVVHEVRRKEPFSGVGWIAPEVGGRLSGDAAFPGDAAPASESAGRSVENWNEWTKDSKFTFCALAIESAQESLTNHVLPSCG